MPDRPKRNAAWYAEQAELLWQKTAAVESNEVLRSSYLGLAREYEKLAATLQRRTAG
ncbi:MAG: hypothetical protein JO356_12275 [Acidobacteria bacterium]|nr:hypothetical protein [Acidobacteriota bacterium]